MSRSTPPPSTSSPMYVLLNHHEQMVRPALSHCPSPGKTLLQSGIGEIAPGIVFVVCGHPVMGVCISLALGGGMSQSFFFRPSRRPRRRCGGKETFSI